MLLLAGCTQREAFGQGRAIPPLPPSAALCLVGADGSARAVTATPSHAGAYDQYAVPRPEFLNWTVPGVGCVRWPARSAPMMACGADGALLPRTEWTRCQQ